MINKLSRLVTFFFPIAILLFAFKCEKDEESFLKLPGSDEVRIMISDSLYSEKKFEPSDTLSNIVDVNLDITKKNKVVKTEFYIDGILVSEDAEAPFGFTWNTLKEDDGEHFFKAVLLDKKGNSTDLSRVLLTVNTLMKVKISGNQPADIYFILSDQQGKRIHVEKFSSAVEKNIKATKPFYDNKLNITFARMDNDFGSIQSSINIKRGSLWQYVSSGPPTYNTVALWITGNPDISDAFITTNLNGNKVDFPRAFSNQQFYYAENSDLYIEVVREGKVFYDFLEITESPMEIDLTTINTPMSTVTIPTIAGAGSSTFRYGLHNNGVNEDFVYLNGRPQFSVAGSVTFDYPLSDFEYFVTDILASTDNKQYEYWMVGPVPTKFVTIGAAVNIENKGLGSFSAKFTGISDRYSLRYSASIGQGRYNWSVDAPTSQPNLILPEISDIVGIPALMLKSFTLDQIQIVDHLNFSDNSGFLSYGPVALPYEIASLSIGFGNSGDRKASAKSYNAQLERLKMLHIIKQ
jgi:hypothetical protein